MSENQKGPRQEFLEHWCHLSEVQRKALYALAKEIQTASDLVETSMEDITQKFISLASASQKQRELLGGLSVKNRLGDDSGSVLNEAQNVSEEICAGFSDVVTKIQFQDRTAQRLSVISGALVSLGMMMENAEKETVSSNVLSPQIEKEERWIKDLVSNMHLGEVRERFIKHALFDHVEQYFETEEEQDNKVNFVDASDDIELF
ncbi:MAG: hypothetical protein HWE30_06360 [Methylocystaceae bacterium]|nr:hypothetical protein [Methylocystaceae bacterium]